MTPDIDNLRREASTTAERLDLDDIAARAQLAISLGYVRVEPTELLALVALARRAVTPPVLPDREAVARALKALAEERREEAKGHAAHEDYHTANHYNSRADGVDDALEAILALGAAPSVPAGERENGWLPIETMPEREYFPTRAAGEKGRNATFKRTWPDGTVELVDFDGRTTVTHGSMLLDMDNQWPVSATPPLADGEIEGLVDRLIAVAGGAVFLGESAPIVPELRTALLARVAALRARAEHTPSLLASVNALRLHIDAGERQLAEQAATIGRMREALEPFADFGDLLESETDGYADHDEIGLTLHAEEWETVTFGAFRRARAALSAPAEGGGGAP